jgi:hypothetical protein
MKDRQQNSTNYPMPFLLVSSTDHITPVTGATPTVSISKNTGAFSAPSGSVNEIGNGWYALAGNATDRNTLGEFLIHATATGADPADDRYTIVPGDPFGDLVSVKAILDKFGFTGSDPYYVNAQVKGQDNIDFGVIQKTSLGTALWAQLNTAINDATSLNSGSLLDRIRILGWIIRNKQEVDNATGDTDIYKDDSTTLAFSVTGMLTDSSGTTRRLRAE